MLAQGQISINPPRMQLGWMFEVGIPISEQQSSGKAPWKEREKKLTGERTCTFLRGITRCDRLPEGGPAFILFLTHCPLHMSFHVLCALTVLLHWHFAWPSLFGHGPVTTAGS